MGNALATGVGLANGHWAAAVTGAIALLSLLGVLVMAGGWQE